jgi:putative transposase
VSPSSTREEAKTAIFEYVESLYNPRRRHSTLDYLSPAEYEQWHAELVAAASPERVHESGSTPRAAALKVLLVKINSAIVISSSTTRRKVHTTVLRHSCLVQSMLSSAFSGKERQARTISMSGSSPI